MTTKYYTCADTSFGGRMNSKYFFVSFSYRTGDENGFGNSTVESQSEGIPQINITSLHETCMLGLAFHSHMVVHAS